jgi:Uncharacterised nucleotidyltransferase
MLGGMSRMLAQFQQILVVFARLRSPPALIGGMALAAHGVVRATRDLDFLVSGEDAADLHAALLDLGYACLHRSEDAANYRRREEGIDLLFAHRPEALRLLNGAEDRPSPLGLVRVVSAIGLIAFKLQAYVNQPQRLRDLDDVRALLRRPGAQMDRNEVLRYFRMFGQETLLERMLHEP